MSGSYTSGAINFTGLGNGTDFNKLVEGLIKVENQRVTSLERWKSSWQSKNVQFKELNNDMLTLKTTLESFNTPDKLQDKTVSSSNTANVTATATSSAQSTSHTIEIGQLATIDKHITTSGVGSLGDPVTLTDTNFTFSYAGTSYTISNIGAGVSVGSFVNIINSHPDSRNRIRASTIYDGSVHHIQISGLDQGGANQLVISNTGSLIFNASDFHETQNAVNSQVKVDGFPSAGGGWIERPTNTLSDVINGVTLNLKSAAPGSQIELTISDDTSTTKENVIKILDAINKVRARVQLLTKIDGKATATMKYDKKNPPKEIGSILTGNYGVDMVSQKLKKITADKALGFEYFDPKTGEGDRFSALSQIGILTDADKGSKTYGLLKLDDEEFDKALKENPEAVAALFSADAVGSSNSPDFTLFSQIKNKTKPGKYDVNIVSDGTKIVSATINGVAATVSGWSATVTEGPAVGMVLRLDNTVAGNYSGTVSIKQGKTGEMIDELKELTKPYNKATQTGGPLEILQENYKDIMKSIDEKIAYEKTRISEMERTLKLKFSRLDTLLGQYQLKQGQLASATQKLAS